MSDKLLTQCPHCGTSFRLAPDQLTAADGVVRCGSCYQVFNALENQTGDTPLVPSAGEASDNSEPAAKSKEPKQDPTDESWAEALLREEGIDPEELAEDDDKEPPPAPTNTQFSGIESSNDFMAEEQPTKADNPHEISDSFRELETNKGVFDDNEPSNGDDESWAHKMLAELEAEEAPQKRSLDELSLMAIDTEEKTNPDAANVATDAAKHNAPDNTEAANIEEIELIDLNGFSVTPNHESVDFGAVSTDNKKVEKNRSSKQEQFKEANKPRTSKTGIMAVIVFNILAILGLIAQHAYFHFDELAKRDSYRPFYQVACGYLGCQLPTRTNITKIQSTDLSVRSHPQQKQALTVDVVAYNRARYQQPYPDLLLAFKDINNKLIAQRRFKPREYIKDTQIDLQSMPSRTPVHISLDIVDPGRQAVNYHISFLPQT